MTTYMIVEDEPDLYDMLMAMSSVLGVDEVAFSTGEEAVMWIEEAEAGHFEDEVPVLGLIDLRLPGEIDGVMVAERLRKSLPLHNMAVVLMTAYHLSPAEERNFMERADADLLVYKPLPTFPVLRDILRTIARERSHMRGRSPRKRRVMR
ncbi:MAG: response regulator [Anaerolineae bacterium]|nr:response regulator [Anaerolineae bacterium]